MFKVDEIIQATGGRLVRKGSGDKVSGISTDTRSLKSSEAFLALKGGNFDGHDFIGEAVKKNSRCIIVSENPGLPLPAAVTVICVKDTTVALGRIAAFQRQKIGLPVVAVTGSNGKTTVKEMISWILAADRRVLKNEGTKNNQVGLPQTLLRLSKKDDLAVVEIGTNHFGEVDYLSRIAGANIGVITNIGPSHLEFLKNLSGVAREKSALLSNLAHPAIALLNNDDPMLRKMICSGMKINSRIPRSKYRGMLRIDTEPCPSLAGNLCGERIKNIFTYGVRQKSDFSASGIKVERGKLRFEAGSKHIFELSTPAPHNVYNALAAIAVCRIMGMSYPAIKKRLAAFKFPGGRFRPFILRGVDFIDDTYNSNPLSMGEALNTLGALKCRGRKILVMGDMLELGREKELLHRQIAWSITNNCDLLVAVGGLARITAFACRKRGFDKNNIFCCADSAEARDLLFGAISVKPGDLVLVKGSRSMKMEEVFKV